MSTPVGASRALGPDATVAAFPLGGIGTGNVSLGARGELRDWEILNHADKGNWLPFTFFAIRVAREELGAGAGAAAVGEVDDAQVIARVLEAELQPPHEGDSGYQMGKAAGLPRLAGSSLRGEYPIARVDFDDATLGVDVSLIAFSPLVPLDPDDSGIPGAVLRYSVHNPSAAPVTVTIAGSMTNPIGITGHDWSEFPQWEGHPRNEWRGDSGIRGLRFGTDLPSGHLQFGSAALTTTATDGVSAKPNWVVAGWYDGAQLFWDEFVRNGELDSENPVADEELPDGHLLRRWRAGSLAVTRAVAAGETEEFEFILSWHVPNRPRAWNGMVGMPNTNAAEVVQNQYADRYDDAWTVAADLAARLPELEATTRAFHGALFDSSLPGEVIDAVTSTLVAARSTTCFRISDGTPEGLFAAWEGSFNHRGSCEGTCTHVWNYAQTLAQLFPSLERNARRTEFLNETLPDGRMRFRSNHVFGGEPLEFHPAVDGQLGTIVRLYREWRFSGDDEFLAELWPAAKRAIEFAFRTWDSNGDGVLDSQQHNTYDIEFYGENSLANSMLIAALRAAARMAEHLGEVEQARSYEEAAGRASAAVDSLLFNGEYYAQTLDDVDEFKYQYGTGCLSDQLFGQTLAHTVGLGHLLPAEHVASAISAVFRHNFRSSLHTHSSIQRTYAQGDDAGLLLCSWPNGGRPRIPFVYSDEVWTGIEYQVATHLVYEGFVAEALTIVHSARDRHDGVRRNPWNEAECGNHYARSMASWGVLLALTGVAWDAPAETLRFEPHLELFDAEGRASFFFSTAAGWGTVAVDDSTATVTLLGGPVGGTLGVVAVTVAHPRLGELAADRVSIRATR